MGLRPIGLRMGGFFALVPAGFFPLPDPFLDLPLAMLASRCPIDAGTFT
jgi:hypothetical protein